ncbi:hypothetical protein MHU86_21252 [Fragilaria crotonensis]|nr:hypothetical protein MHU86_21252 [Fragilaria crotonensis]
MVVDTRTKRRTPLQQQQQQHQHRQKNSLILPGKGTKMDEFMKNKRPSGAEGYAEKKQKTTNTPLQVMTKVSEARDDSIITSSSSKNTLIVKTEVSRRRKTWNALSNVGNLNIREKWCLSIYIFSTLAMFWVIGLSYSICGMSPCSGTECYLIQDLTLCKATWSTVAFLTEDACRAANGTNGASTGVPTKDMEELHRQITDLQNKMKGLLDENKQLVNELQLSKDESEKYRLHVIDLQKGAQEYQSQISNLEKDSIQYQRDIMTMKRLLADTTSKLEVTTADWKHCKSDVKDEIFKKKACGSKLYPLERIVEQLQGNLTALQAECQRDEPAGSSELVRLQVNIESKESEINALMQNSAKDRQEINALKQLWHKTQLAHADTTAVWKHCKSDVKDEIFKKKACGNKLHASTIIVEELQAKVAALEGECNRDLEQSCAGVLVPLQDVVASKEAEIDALMQNSAKDNQEINSLKHLLHKTQLAHADTTAVWKHCKSDVKDEIFKKKACGDKLHASTIIVEELQAKVAALEGECTRDQSQTCAGVLEPLQDVVANKESEIDALMKNSARDKQEINSLKQLLHKTQLAHADTTAVWKHCKSDVKDEIFKEGLWCINCTHRQ